MLGDFAVGDGLEAMVGEADGSLELVVRVAGLDLRWSSRSADAEDQLGLGPGWSLPAARLQTEGGVELITEAGERYALDREAPSGLSGYTLGDLKLAVLEGDEGRTLPAREDGVLERAERAAYLLAELGGRRTWFDAAGRPLVQLDRFDRRLDWVWAPGERTRLERVINADGVITEFEHGSRVVEVRRGVNLAGASDGADRTWRIGLDRNGAVERISDPLDSSTTFAYEGSVLTRVEAPTGATTLISWHSADDGVSTVERVRTVTRAEVELSARTWARVSGAPSGWPFVDASSGAAPDTPFETVLSDGVTTVRSSYTAQRQLSSREIVAATPAGDRVLQRQELEYHGAKEAAAVGQVEGTLQSRPTTIELTRFDAAGAMHVSHGEFGYDEFGRVVREVAEDGTVTTTEYDGQLPRDADVPGGLELPIGLPERVLVTAPDGLVRTETSAFNDARTAVIATETVVSGGPAELAPTATDRVEFAVDGEGFVTERREFPSGDASAEPLVSTWSKRTDRDAGTVEVVETVAAGSESAATTTETTSLLHGEIIASTDVFGHEATTVYDALGRAVRAADGTTFTYNAQNRPVAETVGGVTITTEYWADGTRRKVQSEGADGVRRSTEFVWDGGTLIGETHRVGDEVAGTASYLIGAGRHARTATGPEGVETNVLTADRHGNVTELTDAGGKITERYAYADYGRETGRGAGGGTGAPGAEDACGIDGVGDPGRNPFRYAGEYTDPTCRQYLDVRSYDLGTMRFISADPAAVMSPYGYTDANPVMRVDPTGNTPQEDYTMTPTERAWNFVSFGVSIAGLIGTALSFLAPMGPFALAFVLTAAAADAVALVSSSVRWGFDGTLSKEQSDLLGEIDMFAGAAIVGVSFGARAVGKRVAGWWAAKGLARNSADDSAELILTQSSRRGPGSGGGGASGSVTEKSPLSGRKTGFTTASRSSDDLTRFTATGKTPAAHVKKQGVVRLPQDQTFVIRSQGRPPVDPGPVSPQRSTVQPRVDDPRVPGSRPAERITVEAPKSKVHVQRSRSSSSSSSSSASAGSSSEATHDWWKILDLW